MIYGTYFSRKPEKLKRHERNNRSNLHNSDSGNVTHIHLQNGQMKQDKFIPTVKGIETVEGPLKGPEPLGDVPWLDCGNRYYQNHFLDILCYGECRMCGYEIRSWKNKPNE